MLERFRPIDLAFVMILILLVIGLEIRQFFNGRFETEYSTTTSADPVDAIRVSAKGTHKATVIWLHGLGESGGHWSYLSSYFNFTVYSPITPSY